MTTRTLLSALLIAAGAIAGSAADPAPAALADLLKKPLFTVPPVRVPAEGDPKDQPKPEPAPPVGKIAVRPMPIQKAEAQLEQLVSKSARDRKLVIKRREILPSLKAKHFTRARIRIEVSGTETTIFPWIDALHATNSLRGATTLRIAPQRDDDTRIECAVVVEQWVPTVAAIPQKPDPERDAMKLELFPLLEPKQSALALLNEVAKCRPNDDCLLDRADLTNTLDGKGRLDRAIRIRGRADKLDDVNEFNLALKKNEVFAELNWTTPPPAETRDGRWGFAFDAYPPVAGDDE